MTFTPPKFVMVRLPRDLSQRVDESRPSTLSREAFVRQAVEAALGHDGEASGTGRATRPEASPAQAPSPKARRGADSQPAAPAPPRAFVERIGCEQHPNAGALRGSNGRWWCGETDCTNSAREVEA